MPPLQKQPGGREPAPEPLRVVQAFVNTKDVEGGRDLLARPQLATDWLQRHDVLPAGASVSAAELLRLLDVRESLRALALANNDLPLAESVVEALNEAAARSLAVEFTPHRAVLRPVGAGVDLAVGRILAPVVHAMNEGSWARMKACRRDACRWLFYDRSRNGSSNWCSMAICGNRVKTRAYRRRRLA